MIQELDRVVLTEPLPELSLVPGDIGTAVLVHEHGAAFEVEFVTLTGETHAIATVMANQVRPISSREIANARTIAA